MKFLLLLVVVAYSKVNIQDFIIYIRHHAIHVHVLKKVTKLQNITGIRYKYAVLWNNTTSYCNSGFKAFLFDDLFGSNGCTSNDDCRSGCCMTDIFGDRSCGQKYLHYLQECRLDGQERHTCGCGNGKFYHLYLDVSICTEYTVYGHKVSHHLILSLYIPLKSTFLKKKHSSALWIF